MQRQIKRRQCEETQEEDRKTRQEKGMPQATRS